MTNWDRDKRLIAARKQYRLDLRAGIPERQAWATLKAVRDAVLLDITGREMLREFQKDLKG